MGRPYIPSCRSRRRSGRSRTPSIRCCPRRRCTFPWAGFAGTAAGDRAGGHGVGGRLEDRRPRRRHGGGRRQRRQRRGRAGRTPAGSRSRACRGRCPWRCSTQTLASTVPQLVGMSPQRLFECNLKSVEISVSRPNSVGTMPVRALEIKIKVFFIPVIRPISSHSVCFHSASLSGGTRTRLNWTVRRLDLESIR